MIIQPGALKIFQIGMVLLGLLMIGNLLMDYFSSRQLLTELQSTTNENENQTTAKTFTGLADISNYNAIIQRPLFSMDRRPVPVTSSNTLTPPPQVSSSTTRNTEGLKLSGVILTRETNLAFITSERGNKTGKYSIGDEVSGWVVRDIKPHSVALTQGADAHVLELEVQKSATTTTIPRPGNVVTQTDDEITAQAADPITPQNAQIMRQRDTQLARAIENGQFSPQQLERMESLRERLREFQGQPRRGGAGDDELITNDQLLFSDGQAQPSAPRPRQTGRPIQ